MIVLYLLNSTVPSAICQSDLDSISVANSFNPKELALITKDSLGALAAANLASRSLVSSSLALARAI